MTPSSRKNPSPNMHKESKASATSNKYNVLIEGANGNDKVKKEEFIKSNEVESDQNKAYAKKKQMAKTPHRQY